MQDNAHSLVPRHGCTQQTDALMNARVCDNVIPRLQSAGGPASIMRLPPELTRMIFLLCIAEHYPWGPPAQSFSEPVFIQHPTPYQKALWTLTWVCRYWREVALASSTLWGHITITEKSRPDSVQAMLDRSQDDALAALEH